MGIQFKIEEKHECEKGDSFWQKQCCGSEKELTGYFCFWKLISCEVFL